MGQAKIKQIKGLQTTLDALIGVDKISETFTTTATDGDTNILITQNARETDAIQIFVNGQKVQEGYSWKKDGSVIIANSLEAGTELVWSSSVTGFDLDSTDEIQIEYETLTSGNAALLGGASGISGTITGNLIPDTNEAYDLGSADKKFRDIYMSGNTLYMGGQPLSIVNGQLTLNGNPVTGNPDTYNSTGQSTPGDLPFASNWVQLRTNSYLEEISANEQYIWKLNQSSLPGSTGILHIAVFELDQLANTETLIASIPYTTALPNISTAINRTPEIGVVTEDGTCAEVTWRDQNDDFHKILLDLTGNSISTRASAGIYDSFATGGLHTFLTPNKNLELVSYNPANYTSGDPYAGYMEFARWDGTNWNLETVTTSFKSGFDVNNIHKASSQFDVISVVGILPTGINHAVQIGTPGPLEIIRFDGVNWSVEYTDTDVSDVAMSPDGTMAIYHKLGNYITLKYQSGTWSILNTLTALADHVYNSISISVNNDTLSANSRLYTLDLNGNWIEAMPVFDQFSGKLDVVSGEFSRISNNKLLNTSTQREIQKTREIPSNLTNFATGLFFIDDRVSNRVSSYQEFWNLFNSGYTVTNGHFVGPYGYLVLQYTFDDVLAYVPGDTVMIYNDDNSLIFSAYVLNNDQATKTLDVVGGEYYEYNQSITPMPAYTTYNIKRFSPEI